MFACVTCLSQMRAAWHGSTLTDSVRPGWLVGHQRIVGSPMRSSWKSPADILACPARHVPCSL
eukprot:4882847-Karenia_brevis.AAC.1